MATKTELFNMALGMCAHDRTVTDADTSTATEAVRCRTFYDGARRTVLAMHSWQWLAAEQALAGGTASPLDAASLVYAVPTGFLRAISLRSADGTPAVYAVIGANIRTDATAPVLTYVKDDANPANWPPLIVDAVACELAARICVPITGNFDLSVNLRRQAALYIAEAARQYKPGGDADGASSPPQEDGSRGEG